MSDSEIQFLTDAGEQPAPTRVLHPYGLLDSSYLGKAANQYGPVVNDHLQKMDDLIPRAQAALNVVRIDRNLSPAGKTQKCREVADQFVNEATELTERKRPFIEQERKRLAPPDRFSTPDKSDARAAVIEGEIRTRLLGLSPLERTAAIQTAAEAGNQTVIAAVLRDPLKQLYGGDEKALVLKTLRAQFPEAISAVEAVDEVHGVLKSNLAAAVRAFRPK